MSSPADSHEKTILESKGILIHDQIFHAVLTDRRIILTRYSDNKLSIRSIYLADIQKIEQDTDDAGDPVIVVVTPSATGEIKKVVLHFSQENFPDPHKECSLWALKINTLIQPTVPYSPGDTPKKDLLTPVLCGTCGNTIAVGSVFCNVCGTKIMNAVQQNLTEQREERVQDDIIAPEISTGEREPAPEPVFEKISVQDGDDSGTGENVPVMEPPPKEHKKKESFFAGSGPRKPAIIAGSVIVGVIILIAVFVVVIPSGSPGFNLTAEGENSGHILSTQEPTGTVPAATFPENVPTIETTTTTMDNPDRVHPSVSPEQTGTPDFLTLEPAFFSASGDPAQVLNSYPTLFNSGDASGLYPFLSATMKSQYTIDELKKKLDTARLNGTVMEKIEVPYESLDENNAQLELIISWKIAGSTKNSTPSFFMVTENGQWKMDSLVLSPETE